MLSSKGRYATRILVYMTLQPAKVPIRKQNIAEAEQISEDYVEQILLRLKQQRLVDSIRGAGGGFVLRADPVSLTVNQVIEAVEGPVVVAGCQGDQCERAADCVTREVWQQATQAVIDVLSGVTIRDLANRTLERQRCQAAQYDI